MTAMDSYLDAYVDRRMKFIVEEWDLASGSELTDFTNRLAALEAEIPRLNAFQHTAADKLTVLETRARNLKGRM